MALEFGNAKKTIARAAATDAKAARLFDLIVAEVRGLSLGDRLRVFAAFKRGDAFAQLDPTTAQAFRNVAAQL